MPWVPLWGETVDLAIDAGLEVAVLLGVVLVALVVVGWPSRSTPTCRRCRADLKPVLLDDAPRCTCGADVSQRAVVRWRGRERSRRLAVGAVALIAVAGGLRGWSWQRSVDGLRWRDVRSNEVLLATIEAPVERTTERARSIAWRELARRAERAATPSDAVRRVLDVLETEAGSPHTLAIDEFVSHVLRTADRELRDDVLEAVTPPIAPLESEDRLLAQLILAVEAVEQGRANGGGPTFGHAAASRLNRGEYHFIPRRIPHGSRWHRPSFRLGGTSAELAGVARIELGGEVLWDASSGSPPDERVTFHGRLAEHSPQSLFRLDGGPEGSMFAVRIPDDGEHELVIDLSIALVDAAVCHAIVLAGCTVRDLEHLGEDVARIDTRIVEIVSAVPPEPEVSR